MFTRSLPRSAVRGAVLSGGLAALTMPAAALSLDSVLPRAQAVVVADVQAVAAPEVMLYTRVLPLQVQPVRTLRGTAPGAGPAGTLACRYEQGVPHMRGDRHVDPLITGSGMEFQVQRGDRVILLIGAPATHTSDCMVLRIEPLAQEAAIAASGTGK